MWVEAGVALLVGQCQQQGSGLLVAQRLTFKKTWQDMEWHLKHEETVETLHTDGVCDAVLAGIMGDAWDERYCQTGVCKSDSDRNQPLEDTTEEHLVPRSSRIGPSQSCRIHARNHQRRSTAAKGNK